MTTQIAVHLPDEMVAFLDCSVAGGKASSRSALVATALEREMRRDAALRDSEILRTTGSADDLDDLVAWTTAPGLTSASLDSTNADPSIAAAKNTEAKNTETTQR